MSFKKPKWPIRPNKRLHLNVTVVATKMTSDLLVGWVVCWSWIGFVVGVAIVLPLSFAFGMEKRFIRSLSTFVPCGPVLKHANKCIYIRCVGKKRNCVTEG